MNSKINTIISVLAITISGASFYVSFERYLSSRVLIYSAQINPPNPIESALQRRPAKLAIDPNSLAVEATSQMVFSRNDDKTGYQLRLTPTNPEITVETVDLYFPGYLAGIRPGLTTGWTAAGHDLTFDLTMILDFITNTIEQNFKFVESAVTKDASSPLEIQLGKGLLSVLDNCVGQLPVIIASDYIFSGSRESSISAYVLYFRFERRPIGNNQFDPRAKLLSMSYFRELPNNIYESDLEEIKMKDPNWGDKRCHYELDLEDVEIGA